MGELNGKPAKNEKSTRNIFDCIEIFYNPVRRHRHSGNLSPVEFERRHQESTSECPVKKVRFNMAEIIYEKYNDVVILRVIGGATFDEICEALKQYFPKVTKHLIWDYTNGSLIDVTSEQFNSVPELSKQYFINRKDGRTAFACPSAYVYGMFRMYITFADIKKMPYKYSVYRSFKEALEWVEECK